MRQSKFEFKNKTIDPDNLMAIKAMLKKEPFFTSQNATLIYQYFISREFLHEVLKQDNNNTFKVGGSGAFPAYTEPFRIPTDLDLQAKDSKKLLELLYDTANKINATDNNFKINLISKGTTINEVSQLKVEAELFSMKDIFMIDVQVEKIPSDTEKALLKKIISTDEEFLVPVNTLEVSLAKKILSILDKSQSGRTYYRTKDFYDIYMLAKGNQNIQLKEIDKALQREVAHNIKKNPAYDRYNLANTKENLPKMTENFESLWGKMTNKFEVKDVNSYEVKQFGIDLINEMTF